MHRMFFFFFFGGGGGGMLVDWNHGLEGQFHVTAGVH